MKVLRIKNWIGSFENSRSREVDMCRYFSIQTKQGVGLAHLLALANGAAFYGIFILIAAECARKTRPRAGYLTEDGTPTGRPMTATRLGVQIRRPAAEVQEALDALLSEDVHWLEAVEVETAVADFNKVKLAHQTPICRPTADQLPTKRRPPADRLPLYSIVKDKDSKVEKPPEGVQGESSGDLNLGLPPKPVELPTVKTPAEVLEEVLKLVALPGTHQTTKFRDELRDWIVCRMANKKAGKPVNPWPVFFRKQVLKVLEYPEPVACNVLNRSTINAYHGITEPGRDELAAYMQARNGEPGKRLVHDENSWR